MTGCLEITSPLQLVQQLYKEAGCPLNSDADFGVTALYAELLKDPAALAQVRASSIALKPGGREQHTQVHVALARCQC